MDATASPSACNHIHSSSGCPPAKLHAPPAPLPPLPPGGRPPPRARARPSPLHSSLRASPTRAAVGRHVVRDDGAVASPLGHNGLGGVVGRVHIPGEEWVGLGWVGGFRGRGSGFRGPAGCCKSATSEQHACVCVRRLDIRRGRARGRGAAHRRRRLEAHPVQGAGQLPHTRRLVRWL